MIDDGEFDPVSCKDIKCIIIKTVKMNGIRKWSVKNRDNVAWLTENPPQTHSTIICPIYGIDEIKLVITLVPQNDICPHGNTYPKNAVPMRIKKMDVPDIQTWVSLYEENNIPRAMCVKIKMKNIAAPFIWIVRIIHPPSTSRIIWITDGNAILISDI